MESAIAYISAFLVVFNCYSLAAIPEDDSQEDPVMICYYGSWATYRPGIGKFDVEDIDTSLCTHIIYTFMGLKNGVVVSLDTYNDFEERSGKGSLRKFSTHAKKNGIKALLAVGGWNQGSANYSQMAASEYKRNKFANSALKFVKYFNYDGLDLDWEYPTQRGGVPKDKENFSLLLKTLSEKLHAAGLILTVAVSASSQIASQAYQAEDLAQYADYVSVMGFDYHTPSSDTVTGLNSPLRVIPGESGALAKLNLEYSVDYWLEAGIPPNKLVVGVPTYGHAYKLKDPKKHGLGDPFVSNGTAGQYTRQAGFLAYYEICMDSNWNIVRNETENYVYAYQDDQWVNFEDVTTMSAKAQLVTDKGLAGMMTWSLEAEDFRDVCKGGANPLLSAVNKVLGRIK